MEREDFAYLLKRLRDVATSDEASLRALLSNNLSTIMEALSVASKSDISPRGPLDRDGA